MSVKEKILNMPAWKAGACILLLMLGVGMLFETIMVHTVFRIFDRAITKMKSHRDDFIAELKAKDEREQRAYCVKYQSLLEERTRLSERSPKEFSYDFAKDTLDIHEREISSAIENHRFDLAFCEKTIKEKA